MIQKEKECYKRKKEAIRKMKKQIIPHIEEECKEIDELDDAEQYVQNMQQARTHKKKVKKTYRRSRSAVYDNKKNYSMRSKKRGFVSNTKLQEQVD